MIKTVWIFKVFGKSLNRPWQPLLSMKYKDLEIIGTSHIAKQSVNNVKIYIETVKPDIVALEIDKKRLYALMHSKKNRIRFVDIKRVGVKGFLFALIGAWAEKKLGELVGVSPGSEIKQAVKSAKKINAKIALIDQDIELTLKRFSKVLTWREKWNFFVDIVKAVILRKKEVDFDIRTVPDKKIIKKMINKVKLRYPNIYKVLIDERNKVMADNLKNIISNNQDKRIVAIVGAGHEEDIIDLLKEKNVTYSFSIN